MKALARPLVQRPWQCLLLLLLGLPFAWAAGVSINNMVITTVQQLSFAQSRAEVMVGGQFTQTATVRLSPGAVSYRSGNPQVATVNPQTGQVSGVLAGEASIVADQAASPPYPAASASYTLKVKGQPVVFQPWQLASVAYGTTPFPITAPTSNNPNGKIVYRLKDASSPVASITEAGQITVKAVGSTTIVATQQPSGSFDSGSIEAVLQVTAASYALVWTDQVAKLGTPLVLQPPASPNTQGVFSYTVKPDAQNRTIARVETVNGKPTLVPTSTGTTTLTVVQAKSNNYGEATLDVKLTVEPGTFAITGFTLAARTFDAVDSRNNQFVLTDPAKPLNSQAVYTYSVKNPADGVVSISGRSVTVNKPGTTTLVAHLSRDPAVNEEAFAEAQLVVRKATPAIGLAQVASSLGAQPFKINVTSNSSAPIKLVLADATPSDFASLSQVNSEWMATVYKVGKARLVASQDETDVFATGSAAVDFNVTGAPLQANTLTLLPFEKLSTDPAFTPPWTNAVGDPGTIRVSSSDTSVATVSGQTITLTGKAGTSQITLTQDATATHVSATRSALMTVRAKTAQASTLRFTPDLIAKTYGDAPFTPDVFSSSGLLPKFSIAAADAGVAQVDGTGRQISILGAGTATITAQVSSADFATTTATATLQVAQRDPLLNLRGNLQRALRDGAFDLTLSTLGSGALSVTSSDPTVATATVIGNPPGSSLQVRVTPLNQGSTTLTVHQNEDTHNKSADVQAVLSVSAQPASISWALPGEIVFTTTPTTVNLPAATSSNTATPITYTASPPSNASLNGTVLTLNTIGAGTVRLTAAQSAGNGYAATQLAIDVPVVSTPSGALANNTLTAPPTYQTGVGSKFTIPFTTNSSAPVQFVVVEGKATTVSIDSQDPSGHTLIANQAGQAKLLLAQEQTATHKAANQLVTITVVGNDPITGWQDIEVTYDHAKSTIDIPPPQSQSAGRFSYTVDPTGSRIAEVVSEVNASRLHLLGAGTTYLYAQQAADGGHPQDDARTRLIVHPQANSLAFSTQGLDLDGQGRVVRSPLQSPTFWAQASSSTPSQGTIAYSSTDDGVASIDPNTGLVSVKGPGETTLKATQAVWLGFAAAQAELRLKVDAAATQLSLLPFEMPLGSIAVPPFSTNAPDRAVEVSVSDSSYATVEADGRSLRALREGTVTVTVAHPATATQARVSASAGLNITAKKPNLSVAPAIIQQIWNGTETTISLVPSSDNGSGAYTLTSSNPLLASVNGLAVTLKQPPNGQSGSATLWLTQNASNGWGAATVEVPVQVIVQAPSVELSDMSRRYGEPNFDLPATVNGQAISTYTSNTTATATIVGSRTVQMNAVGSTVLEARNAAGVLVKAVNLRVEPGDPVLALANLNLGSTTIEQSLQASRRGAGEITYSLVSGDAAEVRANGLLLVKGPGSVTVQASVAAAGNYAAATTTAQVNIADGLPGFLITSAPTRALNPGEEFQIRYRANFTAGDVQTALFIGQLQPFSGVDLLGHSLPAAPGQEGVFRYKVANAMAFPAFDFVVTNIIGGDFSGIVDNSSAQDPRLKRTIMVNLPAPVPSTNLGPDIVLTYNPDHAITLPKTYDSAGNVVTGNLSCGDDFRVFMASNGAVLAKVRKAPTWQEDGWYMVGLGSTELGCQPNGPSPRTVRVTVLPASPELQGFEAISLKVGSAPYTLVPPSSLNTAGSWTYTLVNDDPGKPPVARIENGQVVPLNDGTAKIIATQAASGVYSGGSIEARLSVSPRAVQSFGIIFATYGDPAFPVPRPADIPSDVSLTYRTSDPLVAEVVDGNIQIKKASLSGITIEALEGNTVVAKGRLVVDKATTRLVFRLPPQAWWVEHCYGQNMIWPAANQEGGTTVQGSLSTNNPEGALIYHGPNLGPASTKSTMRPQPPQPVPYNWLLVRAYSADLLPFPVSVEQLESDNYYGARTADLTYYANTTPTQCSQ